MPKLLWPRAVPIGTGTAWRQIREVADLLALLGLPAGDVHAAAVRAARLCYGV